MELRQVSSSFFQAHLNSNIILYFVDVFQLKNRLILFVFFRAKVNRGMKFFHLSLVTKLHLPDAVMLHRDSFGSIVREQFNPTQDLIFDLSPTV